MELHGSLGDAHYFGDLVASLAARDPSQGFDFAFAHRIARPSSKAQSRDAGEPRVDDRLQNVEVDRLFDVIVRAEGSTGDFALIIAEARYEDKRNLGQIRRNLVQPFQHLEAGH